MALHPDRGEADELGAFLALASARSFVAAGRLLNRHATVVTKRVQALERRLGVRLVERTTRRLRLTEAGVRLAERLGVAAELVAEAQREAAMLSTQRGAASCLISRNDGTPVARATGA